MMTNDDDGKIKMKQSHYDNISQDHQWRSLTFPKGHIVALQFQYWNWGTHHEGELIP